MAYHHETRKRVMRGPKTLGAQLGRAAIKKGLSVQQVATMIGATRMTVYNWFAGGNVTNAYKPAVERLLTELKQ